VILPNLRRGNAVEGDIIALAPYHDPRVRHLCADKPKFGEFLSRFTDAFNVPLEPVVLIVNEEVIPALIPTDAFVHFRDLIALCVVPYARSLNLVYNSTNRIVYSDTFWLYPWMLDRDNEYLVASTPAIRGFHVVERFHGQSSPELSPMELTDTDIDQQLFQALLRRWKRHYLGKRQFWQDRALFRSLNMAAQASQLPAGIDTTRYDLGRTAALWVAACEILAHPGKGKTGLSSVYSLLDKVSYQDRNVAARRYAAYHATPHSRRSLPCWLYGELYQARNDFLHGNPIGARALYPGNPNVSLFWLAPSLYRLALTGFLKMSVPNKPPKCGDAHARSEYMDYFITQGHTQGIIERALLRARK
jgi:hypothetical protein